MMKSNRSGGRGATVQERHRDAIKRFLDGVVAGTTNRQAYDAVALVDRHYYGGWWQGRTIAEAIAHIARDEIDGGHAGQPFDRFALHRHLLNEGRLKNNDSLKDWFYGVVAHEAGYRVPTTASLHTLACNIGTSWLRVRCCDYFKDEGVAYWPLADLLEYARRANEDLQRIARRLPNIDYLEGTTAA